MITRSVVIANAGSGKTYLLANRLIRWMIEERRATTTASPDRMLAVTFTRKAAGEILERVLRHLALGSLDAAKREEFSTASQIGPASAEEYAAVLREVVDALHRMSISTIDGFFMQMAGAFGPELGLPEGWRIAEDDEQRAMRMDAIGAVIAADPMRAVDLARQMSDGEPKVEIQAGIDAALGGAFTIWDRCALGTDPGKPWLALASDSVQLFPKARRADAKARAAVIEAMRQAAVPLTKGGTPNKYWTNAIPRVIRLAEDGHWFDLLKDSLVIALRDTGVFSSVAPEPAFARGLEKLVGHACAEVQDVIRARLRATEELVHSVDRELVRMRRAEGAYGFQDITTLIARAHCLGGEGTEAMRERLDRAIHDLALDEFQDTSPAQWTALVPLIDEIMATGGRRFLVVGDPKQSIYAWRGGTPELLAQVGARPGLEDDASLDTSFRSSPVILGFVNTVFGDIAGLVSGIPLAASTPDAERTFADAGLTAPRHVDRSPLLRALAGWTFVKHLAAERNSDMPGFVRAFRSAGSGADATAATIASIVVDRHARRPDATIAVLVSKNDEITACVAALRRAGVAASDEGRSQLLDSPAVTAIMAMLRLADQPDDRASHWIVSREPVGSIFGCAPMETFAGGAAQRMEADRISAQVRRALHSEGLPAWIDRTIDRFRSVCSARDMQRLHQLSVMAHDADQADVARPGHFVGSVASRGVRAAAGERVRVMTVHASKGLEFDEVVLGSLDRVMGSIDGGAGNWSVLAPDPTKPPIAVAPVLASAIMEYSPLLEAFRREAQVGRIFDDVSGFYVGVTRAREALHLVCAPPTAADTLRLSGTRILRMAFPEFETALLANKVVNERFWECGADALPSEGNPLPTQVEPAGLTPTPTLTPAVLTPVQVRVPMPAPVVERIARPDARGGVAPSSHERLGAGGVPLFTAEFTGADDGARGSLAHAWFEHVEWLNSEGIDAASEPQVLRAVAVEIGRPVDSALRESVRTLVMAAARGPLGECLRPARYSAWKCDTLQVRSEMPFVVQIDGRTQRGRMDRVVLGLRAGRVVRAEVLDWKTGARDLQGAEFQERIAPYQLQMNGYRRALAAMFEIPPESVSAVLAFVDRGEIREA
jgi:ATP-dependent exoDNAse (exonuclease V) beta subunit